MTASRLETTATISLEKLPDGFAITKSHLDLVAQVPGADKAKFDAAVKAAETGCPVSKVLNTHITLTATPDPHHTFTGWTGDCTNTTTTCQTTLDQARNVTATFSMSCGRNRF